MCTTKSGCEAAPGKVIHKVSVWAVVEAMEAAVVTSEDELETQFLLLVVIIFKEHSTPWAVKNKPEYTVLSRDERLSMNSTK